MGCGAPRPRRVNCHASASRPASSTLFTATTTGFPERRKTRAMASSSSSSPTVVSTTQTMTSAVAIARSACSLTRRTSAAGSSVAALGVSHPPVSTTTKSRPAQLAASSLRSRVTPGCSSTIAVRFPTIRFTSVDLPTFGRPTTATTGSVALACMGRSRASRDAWLARRSLTSTPRRVTRRPTGSPRPAEGGRRRCCRRGTGRRRASRRGAGSGRPRVRARARDRDRPR